MVLIQLLLPAVRRSETGDGPGPFERTRQELAERFDGLTAYVRAPAKGLWTSPDGLTEEDDVIMVEVVTPAFDREWWRAYAATLRERFAQQAIHVRALRIEMIDDDGA